MAWVLLPLTLRQPAAISPAPCPRVKASSNTEEPDQSLCANDSRAVAGVGRKRTSSSFDSCPHL